MINHIIRQVICKKRAERHINRFARFLFLYKTALKARNRWKINRSELIISYVICDYGGAAFAASHAENQGKQIIDVGS